MLNLGPPPLLCARDASAFLCATAAAASRSDGASSSTTPQLRDKTWTEFHCSCQTIVDFKDCDCLFLPIQLSLCRADNETLSRTHSWVQYLSCFMCLFAPSVCAYRVKRLLSLCTDGEGVFLFFVYLFIFGWVRREEWGYRHERERRWEGGGLSPPCRHATVTRAAVIGLHIEGFCGAAGWANSQLDLSDGIQSSSLPSPHFPVSSLARALLFVLSLHLFDHLYHLHTPPIFQMISPLI